MATEATADDFFALGLHPDTLSAAQAQVSRVVRVGAGAGAISVHESTAPTGVFQVILQVMGAGAPGAAMVRWSLDNGVSWSATVIAPAGAPLVLGASGLAVVFDGAFVVGDLYTFAAARALERHLAASKAKIVAYLRRRFPEGLPSWDASLIAAQVHDASLSILTQRGFDPRNPGDKAVASRASEALRYITDVGAAIAHPDGALAEGVTAPVVFSEPRRED